jgi:hypothetical protein
MANMDDSWYDIQDELMETPQYKKKEVIEGYGSGIFNVLGNNMSNSFISTKPVVNKDTHVSAISIEDILLLNYCDNKISELELLKYQCYVSGQLKKYTALCKEKLSEFNFALHFSKLEWLLKSSCHLAKNRNQKDIKLKKKVGKIQRNSYEFCGNGYKCNNTKMGKCHQKHFVYNYVGSDIHELLKYLQTNKNECDIKEVYVTINTINFVFNHMYDELFVLTRDFV